MPTIAIDSEETAWSTLRKVLDNELSTDDLHLDFSKSDWIEFRIIYKGDKFHQSLTASAMKGLLEYQAANFRTIALLTKLTKNAGKLKDTQKDRFELVFKISDGSTEAKADGKGIFENLTGEAFTEAVKKMTGKQLTILILVYLVSSYGSGMYAEHLKSVAEEQRLSAQRDNDTRAFETINKLIEKDRENQKTLADAAKKYEKAEDIIELQEKAIDVILKNTSGADHVKLQDREITGSIIERLNKQTRRKPRSITLDKEFIIRAVEPQDDGTFKVKVEDQENNQVFPAVLTDPVSIQRSKRAIQFAEWNSKPVRIVIRAMNKGDGPYDAEIIRAYRQKAK